MKRLKVLLPYSRTRVSISMMTNADASTVAESIQNSDENGGILRLSDVLVLNATITETQTRRIVRSDDDI